MSRILSGKQVPSYKICQMLFRKLEMSPQEQKKFLTSVAMAQKARGQKRMSPALRKCGGEEPREVTADLWRAIADWYHGAIMELTFVEDFESDPQWIARRLGISIPEVNAALRRLIRLGMLREDGGIYCKTNGMVTSAQKNVTTPAHRRLQRQVLKRAIASLENDALETRNMTSMAMAIDPDLLPKAKAMIQEFARGLCHFLESGKRRQVYQLGVCLYPLTKGEL